MASLDKTIREIEKQFGPQVSRAFLAAIDDIRSNVVMRRVTDALERGDIDGALEALNIETSAFNQLRVLLAQAYGEAGAAVATLIKFDPPGETKAIVRFDITNPVAERSLQQWLGQHIVEIAEETRQAARNALSAGYAQGQGPRQIALDVVGRVGPSGRRTGGTLGLTTQQEGYVRNMREYLRTGQLDKVLRMSKRDRRFDRSIQKLIREGKTPTAKQIELWTGRYSDQLLKLRGTNISRTETAAAVEQGRFDGFRQNMDAKQIPYQYATKKWRHGGGGMQPRVQHVHENEQEVFGLLTPFIMPDGTNLLYPHDPNAPANHVINCTCSLLIRIDWVRMRRDGLV